MNVFFRIQPLGFTVHPVSKTSLLRDRARSGTSIADVEPMGIDKTVGAHCLAIPGILTCDCVH